MEDPSIFAITCSGCGGTSFSAGPEGVPICNYCGVVYAPPTPRCPRCGAVYVPGAHRCLRCGAILTRECPVCGTRNPLLAKACLVCGQTLDVTDALFARLASQTPDQVRQMRKTGARIKAEEARASKARSAQMWAEEDRRLEEQASARARRVRQEQLIISLVVGLVAIAVVVAIVIAVTVWSRTPAPPLQN